MVILSCGHKGDEFNGWDGIPLVLKETDCDAIKGFYNCLMYVRYCAACAKITFNDNVVITSQEEEDDWFKEGDK